MIETSTDEVARLRGCLNDLVGIMALPALWAATGEPQQIVSTLLDALLGMLQLAFVLVRLNDPDGGPPIEMMRRAEPLEAPDAAREFSMALDASLGNAPLKWPSSAWVAIGNSDFCVASARLGVHGEIGIVVAGCERAGFPDQAERLLLDIAANQAAMGLQQARLLSAQKRVARELDQRVAQRTAELAKANEELRKEVIERRLTEEKLRHEERELERSEAFLAEAQQLARIGSFSWRVGNDEITWSEQLYRIFEFEPGLRITLERIATRIHPDDLHTLTAMIASARQGADDLQYEHRLLMADGSVKYLHLLAHGTEDKGGGSVYIGAVQDVTRRRHAEEALAQARSELAQVNRITSLGVLTAAIAHEVSQPLAGIVTNASTCARMLAAEPPNIEGARETARRTIRDGNRASEVITRLRDLFRGKDLIVESVDLTEATREVLALTLNELQRNRVILRPELDDRLPPVLGDRVQLQQVILNLLRNASDAMVDIEDRPRELLIKTEPDGDDRVRLTVKDVGVGFVPQQLDKLFEAFHTTKKEGMGIGLSVSRSIIERHNGSLWAAVNDGPGATFSFSIPCGSASAGGAADPGAIGTAALMDAHHVVRSL
jgi:signal transduction histidine kinase